MPKDLIIKLVNTKVKKKILKTARETAHYLQEAPIQMKMDFSLEMTEARGKWHNIPYVLKEKNCQPQMLYLVKKTKQNKNTTSKLKGK